MLSFIFFALAAICNAVMDTIQFHFPRSWFYLIKNDETWFWFQSDYIHKYVRSDPRNKLKLWFWKIPKPPFLWDAWHCSKALMILFCILSIVTCNFHNVLVGGCLYVLVWWICFEVVYNFLIIKK